MALPVPPCSDAARFYARSPLHLAIFNKNYASIRLILLPLPKPPLAGSILTEGESIEAERRATLASSVLDFRDVPGKESPLGLAVRLRDPVAVEMLMRAGADVSLQNAAGWTPLQEAICAREEGLTAIILRHYQVLAWAKYMRRLPALAAIMTRMRDFYMELTWNFESSVIPFISRIAPSDTYHIWKRGSCLRADMTLAGFDGLRIKRKSQSLMFFGDGAPDRKIKAGTLIVLNHEKKEFFDALEGSGGEPTEAELAQDVQTFFQTNVYRAGIDVSGAKVMPQTSWRGGNKTEVVNGYKTKVHEMHNVAFRFKSRRVPGAMTDEELLAEEGREKKKRKGKKGGKEEGAGGEEGGRESGPLTPQTPSRRSLKAESSGRDGHGEDEEDYPLELEDVLTEDERKQLNAALAARDEEDDEDWGEAGGRANGVWEGHGDDDVSKRMRRLSVNEEGAAGEGSSGSGADETKNRAKWGGGLTGSNRHHDSEKDMKAGPGGGQAEASSGEGASEEDSSRNGVLGRRRSRDGEMDGRGARGKKADRPEAQGGARGTNGVGEGRGWSTSGSEMRRKGHGERGERGKQEGEEKASEGWQKYEKKEENEFRKGLRPMLWLTEDFPLDMKELMPLLDLLANKVKAVRRVKELLMTKLPPGTVPVKVAIPIIPTIRVSVTFSTFQEHQAPKTEEEDEEEFHTPPGSPERDEKKAGWLAWVRGKHKRTESTFDEDSLSEGEPSKEDTNHWAADPFQIPEEYKWVDLLERKRRDREKRKRAKAKARAKREGVNKSTSTASPSPV